MISRLFSSAARSALGRSRRVDMRTPARDTRTDLQRHDLSIPGRETVQVRVDFDPGATAPKHTHPGEEIVYVLEGTLEYRSRAVRR